MLLYERVMRTAPAMRQEQPELVAALERATVVRAENVARYYFLDSEQDVWSVLRDFPNVAPPWPIAFYEWTLPKQMNVHGRLVPIEEAGQARGVLIWEEDPARWDGLIDGRPLAEVAKVILHGDVRDWIRSLSSEKRNDYAAARLDELYEDADLAWAEMRTDGREHAFAAVRSSYELLQTSDVAWALGCTTFGERADGSVTYSACRFTFFVRPDGTLAVTPQGNPIGLPQMDRETLDVWQEYATHAFQPLHIPFLATSFAHCRNVLAQDVVPPPKLSQAQLKRHGVPKVTYKELLIEPLRQLHQGRGNGVPAGSQRSLHIARGHFKHFSPERPLFGKHTGQYWWPQQVRGTRRDSVVIKDYAVDAPVNA